MPEQSHGNIPGVSRRWWVLALIVAASTGLTLFATYYSASTVRLQALEQFHSTVLVINASS